MPLLGETECAVYCRHSMGTWPVESRAVWRRAWSHVRQHSATHIHVRVLLKFKVHGKDIRHFLPPQIFNITQQFDTQWSIIVKSSHSPIDFECREKEKPSLQHIIQSSSEGFLVRWRSLTSRVTVFLKWVIRITSILPCGQRYLFHIPTHKITNLQFSFQVHFHIAQFFYRLIHR